MTFTQVVGRFIKEYLPKRYKDKALVGWFKNELIYNTSYRYLLRHNKKLSSPNDFCFLILLENYNGTSIYGVINRLVEYIFRYSSPMWVDANIRGIRRLWRDYVNNYVISPKPFTKFWKYTSNDDIKLRDSFDIRKIQRCSEDDVRIKISFLYDNMWRRRIVSESISRKLIHYRWGR